MIYLISYEAFRRLLKEKGLSSYYLRNKCGNMNLDSKTIKRLMQDESVSTNAINALCNILKCGFDDIMIFQPDDHVTPKDCKEK